MIFVIDMLVRRSSRRRHVGVIAVDICAQRGRNDTGGDGLARQTVREMTAVADIDPQSAIQCRLDHGVNFALTIDEGTYTTVGGYVLGRLGRRPKVGDAIECDGRKMRVDALDGLRVAKVWLSTASVGPEQPERVRDHDE